MERIVTQVQFSAVSAPKYKRVAAYARVSSGKDAMLHSLSAQVSYYSGLIQNHSGWQYVGVYADEALAGTKDNRENFQRLLADCRAGLMDMVITTSFARNTVTLLETVRELKALGIDIYFEKEGIWAMDSKGELLAIVSSLAQEESRSISENVTWGQRKRFADGKVSTPYSHFLGYRKGEDGLPEIVPEEAEIVRSIYRMCIEGKSTNAIAKHLTESQIPTPAGKEVWQRATVESILKNEKYKGSALLQKKFTVDFLQKKMKVNEGEVPQYYVEHSHEAIIAPEEWEKVQLELARRKASGRQTHCASSFSGKIICGDCGEFYGSKVWHSTSKYRRTIWQCNAKFHNEEKCRTPHLYEDDLKQHFITALSELLTDRAALLEDGRLLLRELLDFTQIEEEQRKISEELNIIAEMIRRQIAENAAREQSQTAYTEQYDSMAARYEDLQAQHVALQQQKERRQIQADAISGCLFALQELDLLQVQFSEALWNATVERVTVYADERLVFRFKNGAEITVKA